MSHKFPTDFSPPVRKLILLGDEDARRAAWPDYTQYGISQGHIPELLRIIQEIEAFWPEEDLDADELSAPIHAWRALGQLKAQEAIQPLIELIQKNEKMEVDWIMEEIPDVIGMIGPVCLPALQEYLLNPEREVWASVTIAHCLVEVGNRNPESRTACVEILRTRLEGYATNDETVNGFLISYLVDLKDVESVALVERAFQAGRVDLSVLGDFEEYQIELGLLKERLTPLPRFGWHSGPQIELEAVEKARKEEERRKRQQAQKEKKKRKQARKTRRGKRGKSK